MNLGSRPYSRRRGTRGARKIIQFNLVTKFNRPLSKACTNKCLSSCIRSLLQSLFRREGPSRSQLKQFYMHNKMHASIIRSAIVDIRDSNDCVLTLPIILSWLFSNSICDFGLNFRYFVNDKFCTLLKWQK